MNSIDNLRKMYYNFNALKLRRFDALAFCRRDDVHFEFSYGGNYYESAKKSFHTLQTLSMGDDHHFCRTDVFDQIYTRPLVTFPVRLPAAWHRGRRHDSVGRHGHLLAEHAYYPCSYHNTGTGCHRGCAEILR